MISSGISATCILSWQMSHPREGTCELRTKNLCNRKTLHDEPTGADHTGCCRLEREGIQKPLLLEHSNLSRAIRNFGINIRFAVEKGKRRIKTDRDTTCTAAYSSPQHGVCTTRMYKFFSQLPKAGRYLHPQQENPNGGIAKEKQQEQCECECAPPGLSLQGRAHRGRGPKGQTGL